MKLPPGLHLAAFDDWSKGMGDDEVAAKHSLSPAQFKFITENPPPWTEADMQKVRDYVKGTA